MTEITDLEQGDFVLVRCAGEDAVGIVVEVGPLRWMARLHNDRLLDLLDPEIEVEMVTGVRTDVPLARPERPALRLVV